VRSVEELSLPAAHFTRITAARALTVLQRRRI
jgi:hypothetical protein